MSTRDEGPVYYREIQKNAYLKRIPNDVSGSKLRPLGHKKAPLKPMWTLFCVHNGRTPFLEQYPEPESPGTLAHRPLWRACLRAARHVTASVKPHPGDEYDFLIDTDGGPVRMLAPDWDSMQDWVSCLRSKLCELRALPRGENVYCLPPAAAAPRAPARDPTSPLPPTPAVPVDRVPGIELITPPPTQPAPAPAPDPQAEPETETETEIRTVAETGNIDISSWDSEYSPTPGTSQDPEPSHSETKKSVTKICGQNICLDDSILKRNTTTDSDEDFFAEIDRIHESVENLSFSGIDRDITEDRTVSDECNEYSDISGHRKSEQTRQDIRSEIRDRDRGSDDRVFSDSESDRQVASASDNVEVNRKDKIDSLKLEGFMQRLVVNDGDGKATGSSGESSQSNHPGTNVTVIQVSNKPPHTAIPVLGPETDVFDFEFKQNLSIEPRSTDSTANSFVNIVNTEVNVQSSNENTYGAVFSKDSDYGHISLTTTVNLSGEKGPQDSENTEALYERLCMASTSNIDNSPLPLRKVKNVDKFRKSSLPNLDSNAESVYEYLFPNFEQTPNGCVNATVTVNEENSASRNNEVNINNNNISNGRSQRMAGHIIMSEVSRTNIGHTDVSQNNISDPRSNINELQSNVNGVSRSNYSENSRHDTQNSRVHVSLTNSVSVGNASLNSRVSRSNIERSHSQNAYDSSPSMRDHLIRRVQNTSPKRDSKSDKPEPANKPIWKRGLTELSLLSRLRGLTRKPAPSTPVRDPTPLQQGDSTPPAKAPRRGRGETRDPARRRSSSLTNAPSPPLPALQPLRARQAATLRAEQRRGAAVAVAAPAWEPRLFVDYMQQVWVAWWGLSGGRCGGRCGDRVAAVGGAAPATAAHAARLAKAARGRTIDMLFHRVPLGKIYVLNKRDLESIGMKLDNECNIASVLAGGPAARAGLPPAGRWAVTEVNGRPVNLVKGGEEDMNRLSLHGTEVSVLIQPSPLVKKIRAAIKANKSLLSTR